MNKKKRERLANAIDLLRRAEVIVSAVSDEESDDLDRMPENLQSSQRYEAMEDAVDNLNDAIDSLSAAAENITSAIDSINEASK
jgi:methyl-accepting chemotaxis protein